MTESKKDAGEIAREISAYIHIVHVPASGDFMDKDLNDLPEDEQRQTAISLLRDDLEWYDTKATEEERGLIYNYEPGMIEEARDIVNFADIESVETIRRALADSPDAPEHDDDVWSTLDKVQKNSLRNFDKGKTVYERKRGDTTKKGKTS